MRGYLAGLCVVAVAAQAGTAVAAEPPPLTVPQVGHFRSVLAQGEGQQLNALEFGQYQLTGNPPATYTNQQPLYVDVMPHAASLTPSDLDVFYKPTDFGSMPGGIGSTSSPRPGVQIFRDAKFGMAHIYGDTRADVMFGAGYATAEERLFAMDALRHAAKGTLAELTGPAAAEMDRRQLTDQDFTDEELRRQFEDLPTRLGPAGRRGHDDVQAYVDGINARIQEDLADPTKLPAEYAALNVRPRPWDVSDTAAMAVLLVTQFTVSNGGEERNAQMQLEFQKRFGKHWRGPWGDLREGEDPEALTAALARHESDRPGRVRKGRNLVPDLGSIRPYNPQVAGSGAAAESSTADWVKVVNRVKQALPHHASNGVAVSGKLSKSGRPLWAAGPQVDYWSPQIFVEYELHGGGLDASGVSFPGASPWPLIGHGIDFAWSGTSANGDNQDTFVETLCNEDGSPATPRSRSYMYKGKCIPLRERDVTVTTPPPSAGNTNPPETITYRPLRSVHGPVFAFATVAGKPVALTKAKGVDFHELDAVIPFMRLAENAPTDYRSFAQTMGLFPGTENWFYVDDRHTGFMQGGLYPKHQPGTDVDLPMNGDGTGDWVGFDPATYAFKTIPPSHRPRAFDTTQPIAISWNNKEAPGWRKGPAEWTDGPVHRALLLHRYLRTEIKAGGGKTDLTGLTKAVNEAATTDLIGAEVYPWMRRAIGAATGDDARFLAILDDWRRSGSHRLDENGDNVYEHSAAVSLMDAWWPRFVRASFEPALGKELFDKIVAEFLGLGRLEWDWASHVQKDLRNVLGRKVRGRYSQVYCGGPARGRVRGKRLVRVRSRCRTILLTTLRAAVADVKRTQGSDDPAQWKVPATCQKPVECDQNVPTALGAVETPPFPWQNRGTFHQVVELAGRR
ncbi:MAG TPA: penicillin acylase family protein [Thermoleophilaceae bacterium]|nr:penicillin acylase family protein [Thermoleophilaceae bacterium]